MYNPPLVQGITAHPCDLIVAWAVQKLETRCVCDLGCGIGRNLMELLDTGLIDYGYGVDSGAHDSFRIGNVTIPDALAGRICLQDGEYPAALSHEPPRPFDLVFSNNVLEHVDYPEALLAISLILAPNALHTLPHERHHWDPWHQHSWNVEELVALCEPWGEVVTADQIPGGNMFVLMRRSAA